MAKRKIPDGAGDDVAGIFGKLTPGLKRKDGPADAPKVPHQDRPDRTHTSEPPDIGNPSKKDIEAYQAIRNDHDDTRRQAENTGIPQDVLDRAKRNLFLDTQSIPNPDGTVETGRFTPAVENADKWKGGEHPDPNSPERQMHRRLVAHEYIESKLMERGIPYAPNSPEYWQGGVEPGYRNPTAQHHGAHDIAPHENLLRDPFSHYERSFGWEPPDVVPNENLSNLDEVVDAIVRARRM